MNVSSACTVFGCFPNNIVIVFAEWKRWRQKHSARKRLTELLEWVLIKLRRHLTQTCLRWILIHHQERHPHHRLLIVNQVQVRYLIHDRKSFLCAGNNRAGSILFFYYYLVLIIIFIDEASEAFLQYFGELNTLVNFLKQWYPYQYLRFLILPVHLEQSLCCVSERKLHSLHIASAQLTREMINNLFGPSTILTCSGSFLYWKWIDVTQKEGLLFTLTPVVLLYQKYFEKLPKNKI